MVQTHPRSRRPEARRAIIIHVVLMLLLTTFLSACSPSSAQSSAQQQKAKLDEKITYAKDIGVPEDMLQSILKQKDQLDQSKAPFALFSPQTVDNYYNDLATSYERLISQVTGIEDKAVQEIGSATAQQMKDFEKILIQRQSQGFVQAATFADIYNETRTEYEEAETPKELAEVKNKASDGTEALELLGTAYEKLTTLRDLIKLLKESKVDTAAFEQYESDDLELMRKAKTAQDFKDVISQLDAQLQTSTTHSSQTIPYVGKAKLEQLSKAIADLKKYGGDASSFEERYKSHETSLDQAKTVNDFLKFASEVDKDINDIRLPSLQAEANYRVQEYHNRVNEWRPKHIYHNPFDGQDYQMGNAYAVLPDGYGVGSELNAALEAAYYPEDYQGVIDLAKGLLKNFEAMDANYNDKTPWDQPHASDRTLMEYYGVTSGLVIIASLHEQAARIYQDGKLIRATQFVSGRYERPTPPGFTYITRKQSPIKFRSFDPPGSPMYYEPLDLSYGMLFHVGEYYFHDVTWRGVFGVGDGYRSDLPHYDPVDAVDGGNGSHGCINLRLEEVAWWYENTPYNTPVIVY